MSFQDELKKLFVEEHEIPEEFRISEIHQNEYLVNGEMKQWDGPVSEVYSPINIPTADGLKRKLIGTYPLGTEKEAFEALDAALAAYDNGRGVWPTMRLDERINCLSVFARKMTEQR